MVEQNKNKLATPVIPLGREMLPTWNIVAIAFMLAGSITSLISFTTMIGRHVPTGSVMGFEGPSYFYITGIWGFVLCAFWIIPVIVNWKQVHITIDESSNINITETYLRGKKELVIPVENVALVTVKRFPSAGNVTWLVMAIGWTAFVVQFAVSNFRLPFMSFPLAGTILVIFASCVMVTGVIAVARPGMKLVFYDATARHVISFPGINDATKIMQKIAAILEERYILIDRENHANPIHDLARIIVNLSWIVAGIVNVGLLLSENTSSVLNQGSAWALVITGVLGLLEWRNHKNSILSSSLVPRSRDIPPASSMTWVSFWLDAFFVISTIILLYFFGRSIAGVIKIPGYEPWRAIVQAMISALFLSWVAWMGTLKLAKTSVSLEAELTAILTPFTTRIVATGRKIKGMHVPLGSALIRVIIYTILGCIFLILGFLAV